MSRSPCTTLLPKYNKSQFEAHLQPVNDVFPQTYRGYPTPEYSLLYQRWGEGEIGTIIFGNTMIDYTAVEAYGNPILVDDHDNRVSAFREIVQLTKKPHNALAIVQLSHPGRQGSKALNPHPISASDVHLKLKWAGNEFAPPRAMSLDDIRHNIKQWGQSAYLAWQAGFDGVQIHCAHGYLLAQFLSPSTNLRTDSYGGTPTNRARLIFEIIAEIDRRVRTHDPTFLLCVKLNSVEFQDRGTTPQEARDLCIALEAARVDFVDLSGGTFEGRAFHHVKDSTRAREAYFIEFAEMIRPLLQKTKVFVTGGFRSASGMALAVEQGACDGVGIGRPLAAEPYLCRDILAGRVSGALENLVPLPMNTQASGTQLHQVAKGEELVSDWSAIAEVERWIEENERETKRKIQVLPRVDSSGFPWLRAERGFAYLK